MMEAGNANRATDAWGMKCGAACTSWPTLRQGAGHLNTATDRIVA